MASPQHHTMRGFASLPAVGRLSFDEFIVSEVEPLSASSSWPMGISKNATPAVLLLDGRCYCPRTTGYESFGLPRYQRSADSPKAISPPKTRATTAS